MHQLCKCVHVLAVGPVGRSHGEGGGNSGGGVLGLARLSGMTEVLLTVGDVAEMCQVHRKTVTRAIRAGRLRAARLGARGAYRLRHDDVERWLTESLVQPAPSLPAAPHVAGMLRLDGRSGRLT